jgi:predicted metallopeptidase
MRPPHLARDGSPGPAGFDFTFHLRRLCQDMVARVEELRHIDMGLVAVSSSQTRKPGDSGMYASLTPLRFSGGSREVVRRGRKWTIQRFVQGGREMLYILNFYLPRFLDLPRGEKLVTVAHELWHIGPQFDGDLRRFGGRFYAHSSSQRQFDAQVEHLVERWLERRPAGMCDDFLSLGFRELVARHGRVYGRRIPAPKLLRAD